MLLINEIVFMENTKLLSKRPCVKILIPLYVSQWSMSGEYFFFSEKYTSAIICETVNVDARNNFPG